LGRTALLFVVGGARLLVVLLSLWLLLLAFAMGTQSGETRCSRGALWVSEHIALLLLIAVEEKAIEDDKQH
jgi:hypothetical protein